MDNSQNFGNKYFNWMVDWYRGTLYSGKNFKICWGGRSIERKDWIEIKQLLKDFNVKTVLEYGSGLSTELMGLEGIEVLALEAEQVWYDKQKNYFKEGIQFYTKGNLPVINKKFDFVLVDGPHGGGREAETLHAKDHADLLYTHIPGSEQEWLINLMGSWEMVTPGNFRVWKKK